MLKCGSFLEGGQPSKDPGTEWNTLHTPLAQNRRLTFPTHYCPSLLAVAALNYVTDNLKQRATVVQTSEWEAAGIQ
jgi:hypothetical protein